MIRRSILALTKYGRLGASSRLRSLQYKRYLVDAGYGVTVEELLSDRLLNARYKEGRYGFIDLFFAYVRRFELLRSRSNFDLVWIEKEALPWLPAWIELSFLTDVPYVLDYDDAIFHAYDLHRFWIVRKLLGRRLDKLMRNATLITAGNCYLAERAKAAGAPWVEVLPTVIDLERYHVAETLTSPEVLRIVWIGSPSTVRYLAALGEPLRQLALEIPFVLRVIGAQNFNLPDIDVELIPWSEDSEVNAISSCAIGIMPLLDSPWERGKCGYKLIQYMACHLPVVASAVGANIDIVDDGINGFLVNDSEEWVRALSRLLRSRDLRTVMGHAGRARVEERYCLQKTGPRLVELLRGVTEK